MARILKIPAFKSIIEVKMTLDTKNKKCDLCGLFLSVSEFYKNKAKSDGLQNSCKDCMFEYKKKSAKKSQTLIKRNSYFIPDIFLIGYGRTQTYQNCCLNCEKPFFCIREIREYEDLFCCNCDNKEIPIPERMISNVNYIGNVIGWLVKAESIPKNRSYKNYKKVYLRDNFTCQYCGFNLNSSNKFMELQIDHVKPWSCQGGNGMNNLVVSCRECNLIASNKWFTNFEEKKEFILHKKDMKAWNQKKLDVKK